MKNNDLIDITEYFDRFYKAFKKFWKIALLFCILCMSVGIVKSMLTYNKTYTSSMTVIVSSSEKNILVTSESTEETNLAFQKALMSQSMQKIIQNDLKVDVVPATLNVSLVLNTNFMKITSTSNNPEDAYNVIQSVSKNYGQLTKLMNDANMIIVEEPVLAKNPDIVPDYVSIGIKGLIFGAILSCIFILGYGATRRTIIKEEHIKDKLHLKSFGTVPYISFTRKHMQGKQLLITNPLVPVSYKEAYRSLTLKIERTKNLKTLMVTSSLPNEGKSTVSSNIAIRLAQKGKKVVLVDFDLRNPSLYATFRIENTKDHIGNYLDGNTLLEDIICQSEQHENLDLIIGFKSYNNSIEMLSRDITKKLVKELQEKYDYVILDVPPLLIMQDTLNVAKYADSTLLVIRQDYAKVYEIAEAIDELYAVNRNILGCVLNGQDDSIFDEDAKGYGYGYRYGK